MAGLDRIFPTGMTPPGHYVGPGTSTGIHVVDRTSLFSPSRLAPLWLARQSSAADGQVNLRAKFRDLADKWYQETGRFSLIEDKLSHDAYLAIIAMGPRAIPFILMELRAGRGYWFSALRAITGENPVRQQDAGSFRRMAGRWLEWGATRGYVTVQ